MVDDAEDPSPKNILSLDQDDASEDERPGEVDRKEDGGERTDVVSVGLGEWTAARASLARLETRLESSKEDVRRAVEYARELEEECDRLAHLVEHTREQISEVESELDEQRGRRRELQKQYAAVVEKLEELSGIRGRYHLERGRREQSEEQVQKQNEEIHHLQRKIDALTDAVEQARRQGFRAELGPLTVELKP